MTAPNTDPLSQINSPVSLQPANRRLQWIGIATAALLLVASSAALASYLVAGEKEKKPVSTAHAVPLQKVAAAQPSLPRCDDSNILGYVAGGAAGGIVGNQVGKGSGNTAATIGGTLAGAYLGGQYIPLRNATCRQ